MRESWSRLGEWPMGYEQEGQWQKGALRRRQRHLLSLAHIQISVRPRPPQTRGLGPAMRRHCLGPLWWHRILQLGRSSGKNTTVLVFWGGKRHLE